MKIAQISPLYEAVPPRLYGGTERVVAYLTDALVRLGHDVTLFSSAEAETMAKLVPVRDQAIRLDPTPLKSDLAAHMAMLAEVHRRADEFDVIHFHTDMLHFPMFEDVAERTLTTLHGRIDYKDLPKVYRQWNEFPLVSISYSQRKPLPFANWAGTVYHGLPATQFAFHAEGEGYLAFLGRTSREKGLESAIDIARRCGKRLKIAAKIDDTPGECAYWLDVLEPMIRAEPLVEFVGEINESQKSEFLGGADALLFPISWPEPFGLVMTEAMACGTPVIAFGCGSVPEVVDHELTGFVVNGVNGGVEAVHRLGELDRVEVRRQFERRFSDMVMAQRYVELYGRLEIPMSKHPKPEGYRRSPFMARA